MGERPEGSARDTSVGVHTHTQSGSETDRNDESSFPTVLGGECDNKLRILLAVHHFPPNYLGGAEWQAYRIARWLKERGHEVRVICVDSVTWGAVGELAYEDDVYKGIPVRRLFFSLPLSPDPFRWSFRNPLIEQHLRAYLASFRPDLLHAIGGYLLSGSVLFVAHSLGVRTVLMPMDFWFLCPRITLLRRDGTVCDVSEDMLECALCLRQDKRRYHWMNWLTGGLSNRVLRKLWKSPPLLRCMGSADLVQALEERRIFLREQFASANVVVTNSRFLRDTLLSHGLCAKRFWQLRQGTDVTGWVGDASKTPSPHLRVGYIGQIVEHKGVDVLIQAFKRLRPSSPAPRLLIYGNVDQFPCFARRLRGLIDGDERISFAGTFANDQILKVHRDLDVLVVPSIWYENSPNVVLEAFMAKTPVVASDRGGLAELVQHEVNGLLFKMGDATDLARQLERLMDQPSLLESLRQGIPPAKTVDEEMEELLEVYHSVVETNA